MAHLASTAFAHSNIAFIKYWGDLDSKIHLPENGSISMTLGALSIRMTCEFDPLFPSDSLIINQVRATNPQLQRVSNFLDHVRKISGLTHFAHISSQFFFPPDSGLASSAASFAALAAAATKAAGLNLAEKDLSRLARLGSGSAARSIPPGFVEWSAGSSDVDSFSVSIAPPDYWDLLDSIIIVNRSPKQYPSLEGHRLAHSSILQKSRVEDAPRRLDICRSAILNRDFSALAEIAELDSNLLHTVTMTSHPPIFYWSPISLLLIKETIKLRKSGFPVFYTLDAGENVHIISPASYAGRVNYHFESIPGVLEIIQSGPGLGVHFSDIEDMTIS